MLSDDELNRLYRYSMALTNRSDLAFDLVHDVIVKLNGRRVEYPFAYARKSLRHRFFDQLRGDQREQALDEEPIVVDPGSLEDLVIQRESIERLLSQIDPESRELIFLIFVEEFTYKEAAEFLNVKIGTLLSKLHRLKKFLSSKEIENG